MRMFWEEKDIDCGLWVIRGSSKAPLENPGFAITVIKKVGFNPAGTQKYCLIDALSDGMVCEIGADKQAVANRFNNDDYGYRILSHKELRKILKAYGERYK